MKNSPGKSTYYLCINHMIGVPSSYTSMLTELLCPFVSFLEEFLAQLQLKLYLLWSLFHTIASLDKGVECIHRTFLGFMPPQYPCAWQIKGNNWSLEPFALCIMPLELQENPKLHRYSCTATEPKTHSLQRQKLAEVPTREFSSSAAVAFLSFRTAGTWQLSL